MLKLPGGGAAIVCGGRGRRKLCSACRKNESTKECDYPAPGVGHNTGTCDKALCAGCAVSVGPNLDHCPSHPKAAEAPSGE